MKNNNNRNNIKNKNKSRNPIMILAMLVLPMVFLLSGCGTKNDDTIRIVHKNYTEQRLLGEVMSVYLDDKGFKTEVSELGGTMLAFNALDSGEVDLYAEYTGSGYGGILKQTETLSPDDTYNYVKTNFEEIYGITWLEPFGFNNTYVLSVTQETADKYGLTKMSDLIPYAPEMTVGCDLEFASRVDGYPGMLEAYEGLEFKDLKSMDQGLTYQALADKELDVNVSYSTDGRIAKFNLVNLEDDKSFFPPYYVTPIMKIAFAEENPDVVAALLELAGQFSVEDMQKYNLMVDEGEDARAVATIMLTDKGLIK